MSDYVWVPLLVLSVPILAYFTVKFGTLGYLRARQFFEEHNDQP